MRKLLLSFAALLAWTSFACAQLPLTGAGLGKPASGGGGYVGPGGIVSGAVAWWGLRCYSSTYAGNVADVYAPADASHTLLTCSSGGTINETIQALSLTCAISCTVKTLYDQSGAVACSGSVACDVGQATEASRPTLVLNCIGTKPCMAFVLATPSTLNGPAFTSPPAQPFTAGAVSNRTGSTTTYSVIFGGSSSALYYANSTNAFMVFGGTVNTTTASDNAFHSLQGEFNGASSIAYVDSAAGNTVNAGAGTFSTALGFANTGGSHLDGKVTEGGVWPGAFGATNAANMAANQKTYWGF